MSDTNVRRFQRERGERSDPAETETEDPNEHELVCPECGETYSRAARYCSRDGTELAERN